MRLKHNLKVLLFISGLALLFLAGAKILADTDFNYANLSPAYLIAASVIEFISIFAAAMTWRYAVKSVTSVQLDYQKSIFQVCLNLVAKYLPGKIWGLAARHGILVKGEKISHKEAATSLVSEQISFFLSGYLLSIPALYVSSEALSRQFGVDLRWPAAAVLSGVLLVSIRTLMKKSSSSMNLKSYCILFSLSILQWLCACLTLVLIAYSISIHLSWSESIVIASSLPAAVITGMLVLITPGGLGVREGVLTLLISPLIGTAPAVACAMGYRLATTVRDIAAGLSLVVLAKGGTSFSPEK